MNPFAEYLQTHHVQPFDVSLVSRVRYLIVWNALHDHPISVDNAEKIRRGVQNRTGVAYDGPLATIAEQPTEPVHAQSPLGLTASNLRLMEHVLLPYAKGMRERLLPSGKREAHLATIESLRQRIAETRKGSTREMSHQFHLSSRERTILECALVTYQETLERSVPKSVERDTIMQQCVTLREYLLRGSGLRGQARTILVRDVEHQTDW